MKVTIKDVAKEANVATSTVSRVLSNSSKISEETKEKVRKAIEKLNYTPNIMARGLANSRTNILAVVVPKGAEDLFENQFFIQAMKGISMYAELKGYYIMYAFKEDNDENWISKFINSNVVDGLCLFRVREHDKTIEYLTKREFPFVVIGRPESTNDILWVDNDNFKAMYDLINLLIDLGNKKIGFVGAKEKLNVSIDRCRGYKEALTSRGIKIDEDLIYIGEEFNVLAGEEGTKKILNNEEVDAVVATDDMLAFGVQNVIGAFNKKEISVVGFNNVPLSEYRNPPLSSVDINSEKLGYYAAKLLIDNINSVESKRNNYIIETRLVERQSIIK